MTRVVALVGAGFSKALCSAMPTADELGDAVLNRLGGALPVGPPPAWPGYFEAWMSRLAEDQPDLDTARNLANRATFERCRDQIFDIILERQAIAQSTAPPQWLFELLATWHALRATVITFNYDTLIEQALNSRQPFDWTSMSSVNGDDAIRRLPPKPAGHAWLGPGPQPSSMTLLKLHGSIAWFSSPVDSTGATMARHQVSAEWGECPVDDDERRSWLFPGRAPFIVPPATAKASYLANPIVQQLWRSAGQAIEQADEIHLLGYSLPVADVMTVNMLFERQQPACRWVIANPYPRQLVTLLTRRGIGNVVSHRSLRRYATVLIEQARAAAVAKLCQLPPVQPLTPVVLSSGPSWACEVAATPAGLTTVGNPQPFNALINGLRGGSRLTLAELQKLARGHNSLIVRNGRKRQQVIDVHLAPAVGGERVTDSVVLSLDTSPDAQVPG